MRVAAVSGYTHIFRKLEIRFEGHTGGTEANFVMADINLTQDEAESLIAMEKSCVDEKDWVFPPGGDRIAVPLTSLDKRENFMLDVTRAQIKLTKATYQNRSRSVIILMRLDLDRPPAPKSRRRRNPLPASAHLSRRLRRQMAIPAPMERYTNTLDLFSTFETFMQHCNISEPPKIQKGLFS